MAVVKEDYPTQLPWTPAILADALKSAFVDAGLMGDWHDSFLSGSIENRILKITYNPFKVYGTTYYWFMFSTAGIYLHVTTGWNTTSHQPTGSIYQDYFSSSTSSTANHYELVSASSQYSVPITRYTSKVDQSYSWFSIGNVSIGTTNLPTKRAFHITPPNYSIKSWIDLDKTFYNGFIVVRNQYTTLRFTSISFFNPCYLRRSHNIQGALVNKTTAGFYGGGSGLPGTHGYVVGKYAFLGYSSNGSDANAPSFLNVVPNDSAILLPMGLSSANNAYSQNYMPVYSDLQVSHYVNESLPLDFGIAAAPGAVSLRPGNKLIMDADIEEWEIIAGTFTSTSFGSSAFLVARIGKKEASVEIPNASIVTSSEPMAVSTGAAIDSVATGVSVSANILTISTNASPPASILVDTVTVGVAGLTPILANDTLIAAPAVGVTLAGVVPAVDVSAVDPNFSSVSLLLHMDGSNGGTTFTDSSSAARVITVTGNTQISTAQSKFGGASALFDGNNDFIRATASTDLQFPGDFTIELWAYPLGTGDYIIGSSGTDSNTQIFRLNQIGSGGLSFYLNGIQVFSSTAAGIAANTWQHLAISRSGSSTRMFVNGTQIGSTNTSWTGTFRMDVIGTFFYNGSLYTSSGGNDFHGYIDELRITKGVARYTANFTPPTAPFPDS